MTDPCVERPIRVVIVDDHEIVRLGIRTLLSDRSDIVVIGEAGNANDAVQVITELLPDVVLLDVRLPDDNGLTVCNKIQSLAPNVKVLILTSYCDDETVLNAIRVGADGYLLKEINADTIINAIKDVFMGKSVVDPKLTGKLFESLRKNLNLPENKLAPLSQQEQKVLALVAQGKTNKEIGMVLGLSEKTVRNYLSNAMEKLHVSRRSQAAVFFMMHYQK
jgi:DNA-binding NarL/FixJ family response regulator